MPKFEIKMSFQAFNLEVRGTREDLPALKEHIAQQFIGLVEPAAALAAGAPPAHPARIDATVLPEAAPIRRRRTSRGGRVRTERDAALTWSHDSQKWGVPRQKWSVADKVAWLLLVVKSELGLSRLAPGQIRETFNEHFTKSGPLQSKNLSRDLTRMKKEGLVTNDEGGWSLLENGEQRAQRLVELKDEPDVG